jgi:hypothetical protein
MTAVAIDGLIVSVMDDVDVAALSMRIDLITEDAEGAVNAGTEGVGNGHRIKSPVSDFSGIVFTHPDSVNFWCQHHRRMKANATFSMPLDSDLKSRMALGEEGMTAFADLWRAVLASRRVRHFSSPRVDPETKTLIDGVHALINAIIAIENPDFPRFEDVTVTMPTWIGGGSVTLKGKPILNSATERAVLALLPRIVELEMGKETYTLRGMSTTFNFQAMDPVDILRATSIFNIELPDIRLRKAGMRAG